MARMPPDEGRHARAVYGRHRVRRGVPDDGRDAAREHNPAPQAGDSSPVSVGCREVSGGRNGLWNVRHEDSGDERGADGSPLAA